MSGDAVVALAALAVISASVATVVALARAASSKRRTLAIGRVAHALHDRSERVMHNVSGLPMRAFDGMTDDYRRDLRRYAAELLRG